MLGALFIEMGRGHTPVIIGRLRLCYFLAMASIFTAAQSQQPAANYSFSDSGGLLAAQAQGSFNTSGALVVTLQPGVYSLRQPLVFSAPTFELVGSAADASSVQLVCDGVGTAIRLSYLGANAIIRGLTISNCSAASPVLMVDLTGGTGEPSGAAGALQLQQVVLHDNAGGGLSVMAGNASIVLSGCSFNANSLSSALSCSSPGVCAHAAAISLAHGSVAIDATSFSGNGIGSPVGNASMLNCQCMASGAQACQVSISNSTLSGNTARSASMVSLLDGFTAVTVSGTVFSDNVGGMPLLIRNAGAVDGSSPNGTGSYNVQVIGGNFSNNQGESRGGLALNSCGSALVSGCSFTNNIATAQQVGQSAYIEELVKIAHSLTLPCLFLRRARVERCPRSIPRSTSSNAAS